ncbi:hypothetical protein ACFCT7_09150 [Fulvivirgaceae bacterium LMO-SS25]
MAKKADNSKKDKKPRVNPELEGFELNIDSFGELTSTFDIDRINEFLNRNVEDKKFKDREDIDEIKGEDNKKEDK